MLERQKNLSAKTGENILGACLGFMCKHEWERGLKYKHYQIYQLKK